MITGFMGSKVSNIQQGTILWRWEDNDSRVHKHTIPNSFFVPQAGTWLLLLQHWMQATTKFQGSCATYQDHTVLQWGDFKWMVPHDASNVATFNLAPGYSHYQTFCTTAG